MPPAPPSRAHVSGSTLTAPASLTLSSLEPLLLRHDLYLPIDGPLDAELSQLLALDSSGPLAHTFGTWHDLLLAAEFTDGSGHLHTTDPSTRDLAHLLIGTRNALGRLVSITLHCHPRPHAAAAVRFRAATPLTDIHPQPHWAILTAASLWAGYLGTPDFIDQTLAQLTAAHRSTGLQVLKHSATDDAHLRARLWQHPSPTAHTDLPLWITLPPSQIQPFLLTSRLLNWTADPLTGTLLTSLPPAQLPVLTQAAAHHHAAIDSPTLPLRVTPQEANQLRALKSQFDPQHNFPPLNLSVIASP